MTTFINAQEMSKRHPDTFQAPCEKILQDIKVGDYVKINPGSERFWCEVVSINKQDRSIKATVANNLIDYDWQPGDELDFMFEHVHDILTKDDL